MPSPLLTSKCRVPLACREPIARPRLVARLAPERARVVVITAPAGFGKTTLAAEWARSTPEAVGWLSLDDLDDDLERFWCYFSAVVDSVLGETDDPRSPRSGAAEPLPAAAVIHRLEHAGRGGTFVLDDFHFLQADDVIASLTLLVQRLPGACRLVVISRDRPPLPLSRLRLSDELEEISARDLRFTRKEVTRFFEKAAGRELTPEEAAALGRATEGWPAGLRLAALACRERGGRLEELLEAKEASGYVFDFLAEEVFEHQDEPLRRFLMLTSILRRFCAPLCAAVTGLAESARLLRQLERSNLFLISLGGDRAWYRYHRLFARFLRTRLEESWSEQIAELHRRAAEWYESEGLIEGALQHAAAAGDHGRLRRLAPETAAPAGREELLSRRELEVLRLLARGESNKDLARQLGVSLSTVKTHLRHIYEKLGAGSRTQAVRRARELALLGDA